MTALSCHKLICLHSFRPGLRLASFHSRAGLTETNTRPRGSIAYLTTQKHQFCRKSLIGLFETLQTNELHYLEYTSVQCLLGKHTNDNVKKIVSAASELILVFHNAQWPLVGSYLHHSMQSPKLIKANHGVLSTVPHSHHTLYPGHAVMKYALQLAITLYTHYVSGYKQLMLALPHKPQSHVTRCSKTRKHTWHASLTAFMLELYHQGALAAALSSISYVSVRMCKPLAVMSCSKSLRSVPGICSSTSGSVHIR